MDGWMDRQMDGLGGGREKETNKGLALVFMEAEKYQLQSSSCLHLIAWGPFILEKTICLTQVTNSDVNLIQKHLHTHTQNSVWPVVWAHGPVKLTHNINKRECHLSLCSIQDIGEIYNIFVTGTYQLVNSAFNNVTCLHQGIKCNGYLYTFTLNMEIRQTWEWV